MKIQNEHLIPPAVLDLGRSLAAARSESERFNLLSRLEATEQYINQLTTAKRLEKGRVHAKRD